jgi:hypothetical protein
LIPYDFSLPNRICGRYAHEGDLSASIWTKPMLTALENGVKSEDEDG